MNATDTDEATRVRTRLPALPDNLVKTPFLEQGYVTAQAVLGSNNIVALDGAPGTGKTTCALLVAAYANRNCAVVRMPWRPAPLDLLRHTIRKITGTSPVGTRYDMQNTLLDLLPEWDGCLIVDELQYTQASAMQELVYLYEETEHAFGLVIIGTGVLDAIDVYPQLKRRVLSSVTFQPLQGAELLDAVRNLDPRLAKATKGRLTAHNEAACGGLLSRWVQTIQWLDAFNVEGAPTTEDLADVRSKLPVRTVAGEDIDNDPVLRPGRKRST